MDPKDAIGSAMEVALKGGVVATILLALAISFIIWKRTHSTHMLMSRIWRTLDGNTTCSFPPIASFLSTQSAVLQFRFTTGLNVRTARQVQQLVTWSQQNDEDIGDVSACGSYFDLEKCALVSDDKLPKRGWLFLLAMSLIASVLATIIAVTLIFFDSAILRVKESGTWFTITATHAKPFSDHAGFSSTDCAKSSETASENGGFSEKDKRVVCKIFTETAFRDYVNMNVKAQQWLGLYGLLFFVAAVVGLNGMLEPRWPLQIPPPLAGVAVGTGVASCPPHRSLRAELPHKAPTLGV